MYERFEDKRYGKDCSAVFHELRKVTKYDQFDKKEGSIVSVVRENNTLLRGRKKN